ncbi:hypothetical protein H8K33_05525 [Undibacterium amnicola]|uniref:Uncharacterized protein n=1 Tax=Undibacterium amnicola TaxID=1834038 RepID=A0ABR6XNU4_9BURK|nr:hypothetical protein [Undibacterium amnicola]MBC3830958.1 hypothetical protein [Undibacterium amnicola]
MAVTGATQQQYKDFLTNGGTLTFTIDANDISPDNAFENFSLIKPYLHTGFELRPSSIIHEPQEAAQIYVYGDSWTRVVTTVYRNGGKIVYKKLNSGVFQAECTIP